eukprot:744136-Prorocentrum_minimum.AAC.1
MYLRVPEVRAAFAMAAGGGGVAARSEAEAAAARALTSPAACAYVRKTFASLGLKKDAKDADVRAALSEALARYPHRYIPTLPASDWSVVRIYPRFLHPIGPS